jgi:uncharacterized protein (TIGR00730 family)
MVVTGAGPGIMAAATEGAGAERSLGVTIRLPFEETSVGPLSGSDRVVNMKYFFTRKLMLMKESSGFVSLPGGFGTLDETLELLTLLQTGKSTPAPVVLLDVPGQTYWHGWEAFVRDELVGPGWVSPHDTNLYTITDDVAEAVDAIRGFWRNYQGLRWVGNRLVIRLRAEPSDAEVAALGEEFGDLAREAPSSAPPRWRPRWRTTTSSTCPAGDALRRAQGRPLPGPDQGAQQPRHCAPAGGQRTTRYRRCVTPSDSITEICSKSIGSSPRASNSRTPPPSRQGVTLTSISSTWPARSACWATSPPTATRSGRPRPPAPVPAPGPGPPSRTSPAGSTPPPWAPRGSARRSARRWGGRPSSHGRCRTCGGR